MQFCPLHIEYIYECSCNGGLHAPQCDLDSLSSPIVSASLASLTFSCRAGNLLNSHTANYGAVQTAHTRTHTQACAYRNVSGACCTDHHRSESFLSSLFFGVTTSGISTLSPFIFIEVVSFFCNSDQNIRGCEMKKWKKRKFCTVMFVVCVSRRVFGVPA